MTRGTRSITLTLAVFVSGFTVGRLAQPHPAESQETQTEKVFELRTYTTAEGKLPNLLARFRDHTMEIFETHEMANVGYWVPQDLDNTLIYIIAHESRAAADENWEAFGSDPEWQRVSEESQRDGRIVSNVERVFMSATDFSPIP